MTYPDNDQVSYRYNARSLLERIVVGPTGDIIPSVSYLPSAQQARCAYGNVVQTMYGYDSRLRLGQLSTFNSQPSIEMIRFTYDFDAASNIEAILDQRSTSGVALTDQRRHSHRFDIGGA